MTHWWQQPAHPLNTATATAARLRQDSLTKPPGSLGHLERLAVDLAAMQSTEKPRIEHPWISIFAADHGVVAEGVSAFPQAVTQQMLANFVNGGAAISVLARANGAHLEVVDAGTLSPAPLPGVLWAKAGDGSANFCHGPAMSAAQLAHSLDLGREAVGRALADGRDLFIGGEMGIGNTTAAAALACALLGLPGRELAGPGTGLDGAGVSHKAVVIDKALALHGFTPPFEKGGRGGISSVAPAQTEQIPPSSLSDFGIVGCETTATAPFSSASCPMEQPCGRESGKKWARRGRFSLSTTKVRQAASPPITKGGTEALADAALRRLGGFEIAALAGAYIACAQRGLPALVDGFITTAAALAACRMNASTRDWLLFAHASAEPGHARLLAALDATPLLRLEMRLGEGSGAAMALPLLRLACELHGGMATFAEAGVSAGTATP
jgi:nicotinate-nucleotide--dimethylbenzimidazole phosphoribosyltransferase